VAHRAEGWAQLLTNGSISGSAIFSAAIGSSVQDAVAPLETRNATTYVISFDDTNGSPAGVAVANLTINVRELPGSVARSVKEVDDLLRSKLYQ